MTGENIRHFGMAFVVIVALVLWSHYAHAATTDTIHIQGVVEQRAPAPDAIDRAISDAIIPSEVIVAALAVDAAPEDAAGLVVALDGVNALQAPVSARIEHQHRSYRVDAEPVNWTPICGAPTCWPVRATLIMVTDD